MASGWARRFLLPEHGAPLGEGLVVASEADGRLFKWKHAGEGLGKVPERLAEAVSALHKWAGDGRRARLLPPGLVEAFELLLHVASTKPRVGGETKAKAKDDQQGKKEKAVDGEALEAWVSTLTKYDALDAVFAKGPEAKASLEAEFWSRSPRTW